MPIPERTDIVELHEAMVSERAVMLRLLQQVEHEAEIEALLHNVERLSMQIGHINMFLALTRPTIDPEEVQIIHQAAEPRKVTDSSTTVNPEVFRQLVYGDFFIFYDQPHTMDDADSPLNTNMILMRKQNSVVVVWALDEQRNEVGNIFMIRDIDPNKRIVRVTLDAFPDSPVTSRTPDGRRIDFIPSNEEGN